MSGLIWERMGELVLASRRPATVYVGESPADLSVYAPPGWDAWLAMWSLLAEWAVR